MNFSSLLRLFKRRANMTFNGLLDPATFRVWLAAQSPERDFPQNSRPHCAIATYLREHGFPNALVDTDKVAADMVTQWVDLPPALEAISGMTRPGSVSWDDQHFTAREILAHLDEALDEMEDA